MRRTQTKHTVQVGTEDLFIDIPIDEVIQCFELCKEMDFETCTKCIIQKKKLFRFG